MPDLACQLFARASEASQLQAATSLIEYLSDPREETLDAAMRDLVAAAGVDRSSVNTSLLGHCFLRLKAREEKTWGMLLATRGFHYTHEVYQNLLAYSPFADKTFLVIEDCGGQMRVRGGYFAPQLIQRVIETEDGRSTRNKQFTVVLSDVPWDDMKVYVDPTTQHATA